MLLFFDKFSQNLLAGTAAFGTYDWIMVAIVGLCAIIGLVRGFTKQLFALCGFLTVLIASILLCKVVAKVLPDDSGLIYNKINEWLGSQVADGGEGLATIWNTAPSQWAAGGSWENPETVKTALELFGLPKILSFLVKPLTKNLSPDGVLSQELPTALTQIANNIICCIALFIILTIVVLILRRTFSKLVSKINILKAVDKILGLVLGAALGIFWLSVLFSAINLGRTIIDVAFITNFFDNKIYSTQIGGFILKISDWLIGLIGI